ncbi:MAG: type II secretion system F family protein [Cyanobacteria bacterium]|nr:type II secretion system F family protein [Cyanobacteriota bacterium]
MKILEIIIAILSVSFFLIVFLNFKRNEFESILFNSIFIKKLNKNSKSGLFNNLNIEFYLDNYKNIKIFSFKIDSQEKLIILKLYFSFVSFILINFTGIILHKNLLIISLTGALIFYLLPSEILKSKISNIRNKVIIELPDFIDVLSSLINAGLNLDESIKYFALNYKGEIRNLLLIFRIKQLEGFSKKEAYEHIGRLSFCEEFNRIVKILAQSEIIGNPVKEVLRNFSIEIRNNQKDQLKIRAEKLESNLIFIIFIFIFIPMLLIFLVPVFPQIKLLF